MTENFNLKPVIITFVVVILGIVLIQTLANSIYSNTNLNSKENETIAMSGTVTTYINETINITSFTGVVAHPPIVSVTFFGNATNATSNPSAPNSKPNISIDVNFTRDGVIRISGNHFDNSGSSTYNITYVTQSPLTGDVVHTQLKSLDFFGNGTLGTDITGMETNDEVNFTKAGTITASPFNFSPGDYNGTYTYGDGNYVSDTKSHPILKLITIFFVLVLIGAGIAGIYGASDNFSFGFGKQ